MKQFIGFEKGVNLGGWLSQCKHTDEHYQTFIKEHDIKKISEMGLDHVRLPIDYNCIQNEDGSLIDYRFGHIDDCVSWCEKYNLNLILDLHKTAGYVFNNLDCMDFFEQEDLQEKFFVVWRELAKRYGDKPQNIAFELLNEITEERTAAPWNKIWKKAVSEIRTYAKETKVIVGGIYYNGIGGLSFLEKPEDENVVFTFHCYSPMLFTHQGASWQAEMPNDFRIKYPLKYSEMVKEARLLNNVNAANEVVKNSDEIMSSDYFDGLFVTAREAGEKFDVAIYCGEYGVIDHADLESTLNWYKDINSAFVKANIGRAAWSYKGMNFGISDERMLPIIDEFVKYM